MQNSELFGKKDWLRVSYVFCDGMKIYQAEMTCPACLGKISPQNRAKEAGMTPKWELESVKRHLKFVHLKNMTGGKKGNSTAYNLVEKI